MTSYTPFWTGSGSGSREVPQARRVARALAKSHPEFGYQALFSAAAYVIRDGRAPRESAVVEEANRRERMFTETLERNRQKAAA